MDTFSLAVIKQWFKAAGCQNTAMQISRSSLGRERKDFISSEQFMASVGQRTDESSGHQQTGAQRKLRPWYTSMFFQEKSGYITSGILVHMWNISAGYTVFVSFGVSLYNVEGHTAHIDSRHILRPRKINRLPRVSCIWAKYMTLTGRFLLCTFSCPYHNLHKTHIYQDGNHF